MPSIKQIIQARILEFGFTLSEITLDSYITKIGIDGSREYNTDNAIDADKLMYAIVPMLLLVPKVSEGQYSREYAIANIKAYYQSLCLELGLPDTLNPVPSITDKSNQW
ncbi:MULTISPECIES: DUF6706 family protein [unclassified Arcicella]|uniref:DUF6706 family protein n=1 Tax=unclassified Arcicella TaxID=2644986 RepID=UPI002867AFC1|nr:MULTISPECIES: DUF6706 family protein [unclassified Arcicella]MDR6564674.1 hypothetical protein [Arcicella sp. BE51]MDR6814399.1 hypothetical protein [Arcicella sp. BE140]MDR6825847.1 hypothetical protein [Arcicella sp. BE139]